MKKYLLAILLLFVFGSNIVFANDKPGKNVKVQPARGNWDTGYFQEAIARKGLIELGYNVQLPKELVNPLFYQAVTLGDVDYWVNGWFPIHNSQVPEGFNKKATKIGMLAEKAGLQGYLISKKFAEEMNIVSLEDFKRDDVKAAFDADGDGKADITACSPGWACENTIDHHVKTYGLEDHVNLIKASYSASIAEAIARHQSGEPIIFYTWAPNWTIHKLKPGEDVLWLNVPETIPTEAQVGSEEFMEVKSLKGGVTEDVKLGFVVNDIQAVANIKFLEKNPAAAKFLELMKLPLNDISAQNTRMNDGEKSQKDIERHAGEWIAANQELWNDWLTQARAAAQ